MSTKSKPSAKASASDFPDIDGCVYLGSRATLNKHIARVQLPDGSYIQAWSDNKPSMPIGSECSVNHNTRSDSYNLWS